MKKLFETPDIETVSIVSDVITGSIPGASGDVGDFDGPAN